MLNKTDLKAFQTRIDVICDHTFGRLDDDGHLCLDGYFTPGQMIELGKIMVEVHRTIMEGG